MRLELPSWTQVGAAVWLLAKHRLLGTALRHIARGPDGDAAERYRLEVYVGGRRRVAWRAPRRPATPATLPNPGGWTA